MFIIGVDPGFHGALTLIDDKGVLVDLIDMPLINTPGKRKLVYTKEGLPEEKTTQQHEIDSGEILIKILEWAARAGSSPLFVIEKVWGRKEDSATSAGKLLYGAGLCTGIAVGVGMEVVRVAPQTWKSSIGVTSDKQTSLLKARELFPDFVEMFKWKKDNDRAEASLIGYWGWKTKVIGRTAGGRHSS